MRLRFRALSSIEFRILAEKKKHGTAILLGRYRTLLFTSRYYRFVNVCMYVLVRTHSDTYVGLTEYNIVVTFTDMFTNEASDVIENHR